MEKKYYKDRIFCRDPFILAHNQKYYLYRTIDEKGIIGKGLEVFVSSDLNEWVGPKTIFTLENESLGSKNYFWAPECHFYNGLFYIFTSIYSVKDECRRIMVLKGDNPLGPFTFINFISPSDWDAIDGTLYVDEEKQPWLVFVREWVSSPDQNGSMVAARLSNDLTKFEGEIITLFYAKDPEWATSGITDGPSLYKTKSGELFMIWSNFSNGKYVIGLAKSNNGKVNGKWEQQGLLYPTKESNDEFDGGHGSFFKSFNNQLFISFHSPNEKREEVYESLTIREVIKNKNSLVLK